MEDEKEAPAGYEQAIERAAARVGLHLDGLLREIDEAAARFSEILAAGEPERWLLVKTEPRFHGLKLCDLLLEKSREAWFTDPAGAVELAELAIAIAGRLDVERYGAAMVEEVRALAWAHLGNASRIASDLRRAEEALQTAESHLERSGGEALVEAQILSFKASLRNSQGRFDEAAGLLDQALAIYRAAKDRHLEGKTLIKKGMTLGYSGRFMEAARLLRRGLARIDPIEDPRLLVAARHNLIWYLDDSGQHREALSALEATRGLYLELGERMHLVRLRWLEGKIARGLGRLDEAETALREARDAFAERGIGFDAALVSLDLAMVYVQRGETDELRRLATEMVPIFESRDVHQEALAALLLVHQAAETEQLSLGLLQRVASFLHRNRHDPGMRFEGGEG
ncbi:MAG TPA: tetratricopeptide repeat protein [Thermoanaerobaculia bacterium]|nr:tetratricopeptide repeat protein [Thermoanaerobaculia bacterium]